MEINCSQENITSVWRVNSNQLMQKKETENQTPDSFVNELKKPQFGTRYLKEGDNVYSYNAWDNVEWDEDQLNAALQIIAIQKEFKMSDENFKKIEKHADQYWNKFYQIHNDKFYKDRRWLFTEFPELNTCDEHSTSRVIFEIGCGVGNTIFPILEKNTCPNMHVYCCDFSETAINILKSNEAYKESRCQAFICDITKENWSLPFTPNSVDIILMIYVLSSLHPNKMNFVLNKLFECLKPGGVILFRDYGRYDLSQLRFKGDRCVMDNFYIRGEGTFVYFFEKEEVARMFSECGYEEKQLICDKRLQINRRKQLKMYRVWIQGKFVKPNIAIESSFS